MSQYRAEFWSSPGAEARQVGSATIEADTAIQAWDRAAVLAKRANAPDFNLIDVDRRRFIGSRDECK